MANPGRDADAAGMHGRYLPAAGKFARLRGRERSVPPRLGSLYSSRFLMMTNDINDGGVDEPSTSRPENLSDAAAGGHYRRTLYHRRRHRAIASVLRNGLR